MKMESTLPVFLIVISTGIVNACPLICHCDFGIAVNCIARSLRYIPDLPHTTQKL